MDISADWDRYLAMEHERLSKPKNKLISIGYLEYKRYYLNINKEDAINRYCISENLTADEFIKDDIDVVIIDFEDEFGSYEIFN